MNFNCFDIDKISKFDAFFITGIGTGVGKTCAAGFIARKIIESARTVSYMKPVQTGISTDLPDIITVKKICPELIIDKKYSCPYLFKIPASPHFAAACENRKVNIKKIINSFVKLRELYPDSITLVEGAGGLMVPINGRFLIIDLIKKLKLPVILVSSSYLGAINHSILTINALKKEKIHIAQIVFSIQKSKLNPVEQNTIESIVQYSQIKNFSLIPFLPTCS